MFSSISIRSVTWFYMPGIYGTRKSLNVDRKETKEKDGWNITGDTIIAERIEIPGRNILREWWRAAPNTESKGVTVPHLDVAAVLLASARHPPRRRPPEEKDTAATLGGSPLGRSRVYTRTFISCWHRFGCWPTDHLGPKWGKKYCSWMPATYT